MGTIFEPDGNDVLIVIDLQYDFCPGGALAVPDGDAVLPVINRLARRMPHMIVTQDWHPAGHQSFASSHPGKAAFDTVTMSYGEQILWPDHCGLALAIDHHFSVNAQTVGFWLHYGDHITVITANNSLSFLNLDATEITANVRRIQLQLS